MRKEYKVVLFLGVIFLIVFVIYGMQSGLFVSFFVDLKKGHYVKCSEQTYEKGVPYTEYRCDLSDDVGNKYFIMYPQINIDSEDIQTLNRRLKSNYDTVYASTQYEKDASKMVLDSYTSTQYAIYANGDIVSLLVSNALVENANFVLENRYTSYHIQKSTAKVLDDKEIRRIYGLDLAFSSKLRAKVIQMYAMDFQYNYYDTTMLGRDEKIDSSIESVTLSSIQNIYMDEKEQIHFFLQLYHPTYFKEEMFEIIVDKDKNITYQLSR